LAEKGNRCRSLIDAPYPISAGAYFNCGGMSRQHGVEATLPKRTVSEGDVHSPSAARAVPTRGSVVGELNVLPKLMTASPRPLP